MTIHEELQGPLRCDPTTTQNCHESNLKKQQEVNPAKKTATLESSFANRREQRCTSAEQSISEPSHLGMAKNGTDGLHMGVHARAHTYAHVRTRTHTYTYTFSHICNHMHKVFGKLHSLCVAYCSAADKLVGLYEQFRTPRKDLIPTASATCALPLHHAAEQAKVRSPNSPWKQQQKENSLVAKVSNLTEKVAVSHDNNHYCTDYFSYGGCG